MSDLYDGNQSRLRVAHRHLSENDPLYRISLLAAPIALLGALATGALSLWWSPPATPLPPAAVPYRPPAAAPAQPPAPPAPAPPQVTNLQELRDRAASDAVALGDLRTRATAGNAEAQFYIGTLYDPTITSPRFAFAKDAAAAADWYERAAVQSYPFAENNLGWFYEKGLGRPKNEAEAARWYRKSADHGDALAQINLGLLYETGRGVNKDESEAARWYRMAADLGNAGAAVNLGHLYESGRGVAKDEVEAARWFQKAVDQNNRAAENELGRMYANGVGVPRDTGRAIALFRRAASAGDPSGVYNLGLFLEKGWGTPRNAPAAYIWYSIAARWGDPTRQSQATSERERLSREMNRDELASAQRSAENWRPGVHGRIGAAIQDLTPDAAKTLGSAQTKGVIITRIEEGSAAGRAGLQPQDVVTVIDREPIRDATDFREMIWCGVPGQTVELWVERSHRRGPLENVRVQLDQAPP